MFVNKFLRDELYSILYSDAMFTFLFNISRYVYRKTSSVLLTLNNYSNPARLVLKSHALSHLTHVTLGPLQHFSHGKHHGVLRSADLELPFATLRIEQLARSIDFVRSKCPKLQILITMLGSCDVRETWPLPEPDVNKRAGEVLVTTHQTKEGTKAVPWRRERYQKMRFQGKIKTPVMWNDGPVEDPERMKELERKEKKQKKRKIGGRARHPDELGKGSEDDDQPMEVEQKPWVAPQERREPSEEEKQRTRDAECFKQATRFEPISYALSRLAEEVPSLQALALGVGRDVHSTLRPSQVKGSKCAIEVGQWAFFEFGKLKENVIARSSWDF